MIFNNNTQEYLTSLMGFFIKKGKKTKAEYLFQNYLVTKMNSNKNNIYALLKRCQIKTSSYLRIIEKRRGKRSKYRIKLLDNAQLGINRGLLLVGRSLYTNTKKAPRQFKALFGAELQS